MDTTASVNGSGPAVRVAPPAPPKLEERRIDAVMLPRGYVGPGRAREQHGRANAIFGPLAGVRSFWWLAHEAWSLGLPNTGYANYARDLEAASLYFGHDHPLAGQPRFEWFLVDTDANTGRLRPAGLCPDPLSMCADQPKIGFRVVDPTANDPAVIISASEYKAKQAETHKALLKAALSTPELYAELRDRLGFSDAQMEVAFGHVDRIIV